MAGDEPHAGDSPRRHRGNEDLRLYRRPDAGRPGDARLLGKTSDLAPGKRRATKPDSFHKDLCLIIYRVVFPEADRLVSFRLGDSTWKGWGEFGRVVLPAKPRADP